MAASRKNLSHEIWFKTALGAILIAGPMGTGVSIAAAMPSLAVPPAARFEAPRADRIYNRRGYYGCVIGTTAVGTMAAIVTLITTEAITAGAIMAARESALDLVASASGSIERRSSMSARCDEAGIVGDVVDRKRFARPRHRRGSAASVARSSCRRRCGRCPRRGYEARSASHPRCR